MSWIGFSPDSKKLVVSGQGFMRMRIFDRASGQEERVIKADPKSGPFEPPYWRKDNKTLFAFASNNAFGKYDLETAKNIELQEGIRDESRMSVSISPDEKHVAVGTVAGNLVLLDLAASRQSKYLDCSFPTFSPDGKLLAMVCSKTIRIWNFAEFAK